ncbi:rRNA 2'-O-methyltransferase fibrillarin-like [Iris pallida]|uniref:rRNA 2'-O-methyltransferase fibrillarin-like n=1 Tax=Iris pallida TaxID=29817 RepID=A0AAX6IIS8_IRIPA|nr:rRNA 2'-O-methyltransferase fibrillarin-like [Iris pallida]
MMAIARYGEPAPKRARRDPEEEGERSCIVRGRYPEPRRACHLNLKALWTLLKPRPCKGLFWFPFEEDPHSVQKNRWRLGYPQSQVESVIVFACKKGCNVWNDYLIGVHFVSRVML